MALGLAVGIHHSPIRSRFTRWLAGHLKRVSDLEQPRRDLQAPRRATPMPADYYRLDLLAGMAAFGWPRFIRESSDPLRFCRFQEA